MSTIPFNIQFISNKRTCSKQKLTLLRVWENEKKQISGFFCLLLWQLGAEHQQVPFLRFFFTNVSFEAMFST
jgi:hypothetical protein